MGPPCPGLGVQLGGGSWKGSTTVATRSEPAKMCLDALLLPWTSKYGLVNIVQAWVDDESLVVRIPSASNVLVTSVPEGRRRTLISRLSSSQVKSLSGPRGSI